MERFSAFWLAGLDYIGAAKINALVKDTGSFSSAMNISESLLWKLDYLNDDEKAAFVADRRKAEQAKYKYEEMLNDGIKMVLNYDREYPERLIHIHNPPAALFIKGNLPDNSKKSVAVIGARRCTPYGRMLAEHYGKEMAKHDITVISGMAYGIDSASHRGAIQGKGHTYAVLGCGPDICYPAANVELYMDIQKNGGIISEFVPGTQALKWHFPFRNRIISGLADLVLIIEAREKSGSLITADMALEQGRDIFAVPGRPDNPLNMGCNRLIAQGAGIALSPDDIISYLGIEKNNEEKILYERINSLENKEKIVYSVLDFKQRSSEEIMSKTLLPFSDCMEALFNLECEGLIIQTANHYYIKKLE